MARVNYGTLCKETSGVIEYVYPKTHVAMVEYNAQMTALDKFNELDDDIDAVSHRVDVLATGVTDGSISTSNDAELFDIRTPNRDVFGNNVSSYASAGEAVRGQIGLLSDHLDSQISTLFNGVFYEDILVNGEPLTTSDAAKTPLQIEIALLDSCSTQVDKLYNRIYALIRTACANVLEQSKAYTDTTNNVSQGMMDYIDEAIANNESNIQTMINTSLENVLEVNP